MLRPAKRTTQSSTLSTSTSTSTYSSDNHASSGSVEVNAGTTTALTSGSTMSALTPEADGGADAFGGVGVDDARKPLLGTTATGIRYKLQTKNRILNDDGSYHATTISEATSSSHREGIEPELELREDEDEEEQENTMENISRKSQWILLAVASGACAAFNGVFAKLTTTQLTTSFAEHVAGFLGLGEGEKVVEYGVRGIFFLLNLVFNGIMWTLFTKALARGTSTVQVSIINTSSNFMITAVLGFIIFSESLPPLWFLGAALLVAGNVIIGRREEEEKGNSGNDVENGESRRRSGSEGEEREGLLGEELELGGGIVEGSDDEHSKRDDDVLDLGLDDEGKSDEEEDLLIH
ncbi:uncharacterized protein EAF01_006444 [Botrytis porri]|uniref:EamA domain-containing protein n=1 Tax=Botrytis porri TaxID=87229 RepID=A0A4Z1L5K1_9HELO|nr:uncharacterized protein EAF01_006444 [Botrytis porri]KAF7903395.1 hypothetical protein EAF01_006444 [Botrytis porri]TGO91773.1 hypothetical protein BPOR_0019g00330 [Botrytis porri]